MTDFRALCAELTFCWSRTTNPDDFSENAAPIIERMNAALAQPEPAVVSVINSGSERLRLAAVGIRSGYMAGHDATVEGYYGDPDEVASEMASMVLAELDSAPQPNPVAPTDEELREMWFGGEWFNEGATLRKFIRIARAVLARWGNYQVSRTSSTQPLPEQEVSK